MALTAHRWLMTAPKAPMVQSGFDPLPLAAGEVAVQVAGWVTLFFGFVLWPVALIWAYVDVPEPRKGEAAR